MTASNFEFQKTVRGLQLRFTRFYARFLSRQHLTFPQFALISLAYHEGEAQMNSFARRLMISWPAVTHLVDRLEREKFICRTPHRRDRRVTMIRITEKGKRAVEQTQGRIQKLFMNTLLEFTPKGRQAIQEFYVKFSRQLERQLQKEGKAAGKKRTMR